jgi:hypothetical protein
MGRISAEQEQWLERLVRTRDARMVQLMEAITKLDKSGLPATVEISAPDPEWRTFGEPTHSATFHIPEGPSKP